MDVSIIIVNYNTKDLTINCIKSIYEQTVGLDFEIILVDNASTDETVESVCQLFPKVIIVENNSNLGFGQANNIGIYKSTGKYLFLLNSDTIILNNAVGYLFDYMQNQEKRNMKIGAIGSYLLDQDGNAIHSYSNLPSLSSLFLADFITIWKLPIKQNEDLSVEKSVGYITGADLFIPKKVFDKIGFFDSMFFMYFEETDLQCRMKLEGLDRIIIPGPRIIHLEGKSNSVSNNKRIMKEESKFKYLKKHFSLRVVILYKYLYLILRIPRILKFDYSIKDNMKFIKTLLDA